MRFLKRLHLLALIGAMALPTAAVSQPYPTDKASYVPTAVLAPAALSAPGTVVFNVNGLSTVSVRVAGTCTSLAATIDGTNQRTGTIAWTALQAIPVAGGPVVTSVGAAGFWKVNASGLTQVRFNASALTASCTVSLAGSAAPDGAFNSGGAISLSSAYPAGSTAITASSGTVANASAAASLAAVASKTTYVCGVVITSTGSTAAAVVAPTITGVITGTMTLAYATVAGATLANQPLVVPFTPCVPASAANTAIAVTVPALGAGNTNAAVSAWGYQL